MHLSVTIPQYTKYIVQCLFEKKRILYKLYICNVFLEGWEKGWFKLDYPFNDMPSHMVKYQIRWKVVYTNLNFATISSMRCDLETVNSLMLIMHIMPPPPLEGLLSMTLFQLSSEFWWNSRSKNGQRDIGP